MSDASYLRRILVLSYGAHRAIVTVKAFVDDSGHVDDPQIRAIACGGCIAPIDSWEHFEREWKQALADFGIRYFHMKHCAHFRGEFAKWKDTPSVRDALMRRLVDVMTDRVAAYIGGAMWIGPKVLRPTYDVASHPYFDCFQWAIYGALQETVALPEGEKVQMIISESTELDAPSVTFYQRWKKVAPRLGPITHASYREVVQLQAADLVAYELSYRVSWPHFPERKTFERIKTKRNYFHLVAGPDDPLGEP